MYKTRQSSLAPEATGRRVVIVVGSLRAGGAERQASLTARELSRRGHAVVLVTLTHPDGDFYATPPGVERIALDLGGSSGSLLRALASNLRRIRALRGALRDARPEVVIAFVAETAALCDLALGRAGARLIASERIDPRALPPRGVWRRLRARAYARAARVVANSEAVRAVLAREVGEARAVHVPNMLDLDEPISAGADAAFDLTVLPPAPLLLNVGRLAEQKNQALLLRAFARLELDPPPALVIAGEGTERAALESLARELRISDRVYLPGIISNVTELYDRASVFAFPSRFEGFPNALVEALSRGCPVVASRTPTGAEELVRDGESGLLLDPGDVEAWASALRWLLTDETGRRALAHRGRELAERFAPDEIGERWSELVHEVADAKS